MTRIKSPIIHCVRMGDDAECPECAKMSIPPEVPCLCPQCNEPAEVFHMPRVSGHDSQSYVGCGPCLGLFLSEVGATISYKSDARCDECGLDIAAGEGHTAHDEGCEQQDLPPLKRSGCGCILETHPNCCKDCKAAEEEEDPHLDPL
jgi:hypothetical protein